MSSNIQKGDKVTLRGGRYKGIEFVVVGFRGNRVILEGNQLQITKGRGTVVRQEEEV